MCIRDRWYQRRVHGDLWTGLKAPVFWLITTMFFCSTLFGLYIANEYKNLGFNYGHSDVLLTVIGAFASLSNGAARMFWAYLQDYVGFRTIFLIMMAVQLILTLTFPFIAGSPVLYFLFIMVILFLEGGYFGIFPTLASRIYGNKVGSKIYGFIYFGFSIANITQYLVSNLIFDESTLERFYVFAALNFVGLLVCLRFNERNISWSDKEALIASENL
eukprot:TRINITY_DN13594_c0_g1_i3.p1 TRINITY_DN13594_c0_g1~~TRINITY_DN13594_c0_g1_i3.p1  ORF type:complete len:236 (+),score=66.63 TRINITY_DN13594_c0_g1_i3:60-710(+)